MKGKSLNNTKSVQSDFLKRVERLCGEYVATIMNEDINFRNTWCPELPDYVIRSHYRSKSTEIRKAYKYNQLKTK